MKSKILLALLFLLPLSSEAVVVAPLEGSDLSDISLTSRNNSYRYYLLYDIPTQASSWPPTTNYTCGGAYAVVESTSPADPDTAQELWDNNHGGGGPAIGTCPATEDQLGTWWILETDTGSIMNWTSFELVEPEPELSEATTTIAYDDWLFVNSIIIGCLGFLALGFILNPIKR